MTKHATMVSPDCLVSLEYLIAKSRDASPLAKKTAIWLLRQSEGLTKAVAVSFQDRDGARDVLNGFHDMVSCNSTTHLNQIMHVTGTAFIFSHHSGFRSAACIKVTTTGSTIWLAERHYDRGAKMLILNLGNINVVDLDIRPKFAEERPQETA
jgi:hypothetical protein